jgi:mono/diheme cytochrome c family protein
MPPFQNSLSEEQRWDVVAYLYSISTPPGQFEQGEQLYQECAECHGGSGQGDVSQGGDLLASPPDFTDPSWMAERSAADLFQAITTGTETGMPAYQDVLTESERWALTAYLRNWTFALSDTEIALGPTPTELAGVESVDIPQGIGTVTGQVFNGSGAAIGEGLSVTLRGFDNMVEVYSSTLKVPPEGVFMFGGVEMPEGRVFVVTTDYNDVTYGSDIAVVESGTTEIDLPLTVYETTTDPSLLIADRLHLFLDFLSPEVIQVTELYLISNPGDKVVISEGEDEPVLTFSLPEEATNLQFEDGSLGDRFIRTEGGFGDTMGIRPGASQYQVLFAYNLPYDGELTLEQDLTLPVNAVILLMPDNGVRIRSEDLQDGGTRTMQDEAFQVFSGENLAAGSQFELTISGRPRMSAAGAVDPDSNTNLIIGLGAFGLALALAGAWLYRQSRVAAQEDDMGDGMDEEYADPDTLVDAIIALDDLYRQGDLPEEAYHQRRSELKSRLAHLMDVKT